MNHVLLPPSDSVKDYSSKKTTVEGREEVNECTPPGEGGGGGYAVKRILTGCAIKRNDILITIDQI